MVHDGLAWMVCVSLPETDDCCSCYADKLYSAGVTILAIPSLDFMAAAQGQFPVKDTQSIKPARHITVDIVSSDIIKPKGPTSNYVMYSLHVHELGGARGDDVPPIQRRYTDFLKLHGTLMKKFPLTVSEFAFPKKLLSGNFELETIARRTNAFEQFLGNLCDLPEILQSQEFVSFFYLRELKDGFRAIRRADFSTALGPLQKAIWTESVFLSGKSIDMLLTVCGLALCMAMLDDIPAAYDYTVMALKLLEGETTCVLLLPLLVKAIRLSIILGKDKVEFESSLAELQSRQTALSEDIPTLHEAFMKELQNHKRFK